MTQRPEKQHTGSSEPFGRIPYRLANAGAFAGMNGSEARVYMILAAHADEDWVTYPGPERIAELGGMVLRTSERALASLKRRRLISIEKHGGGRGHFTVYRLTTNPDEIVGVYGEENPTDHSHKPRQITALNPDESIRHNRENREGTNNSADTVRVELERHGIREPKLSELIGKLPGLTPAIIRELAERTHGARNPVGLLVTLLENDGPKLIEQAERKAQAECQQAEARRRMHEDRRVESAQLAVEREQQLELIDSLNDDDLARMIDLAIKQHPSSSNRWQREIRKKSTRKAARENRGLRVAICSLWRANRPE